MWEVAQGSRSVHIAMGGSSGSDKEKNLVALLLMGTVARRWLGLGKEP